MPFHFERLEIPDIILVEPRVFQDDRGFFMEAYKYSEFAAAGIPDRFVQDNRSRSGRRILRGLHYQEHPKAQAKLVHVTQGEIFDVQVDLRRGSPTYGQWVGRTLSDENHRMLYVPEGFAHGFCVLSDGAEVVYKVSAEFDAALDRGILWNDPEIGIAWPIEDPILSPKDSALPRLDESGHTFTYSRQGTSA
jgi:dTDP-4-dehydrorhamnose 3,5-epimerase